MDKNIDITTLEFQDPMQYYFNNLRVPLEEYSNTLNTLDLLRLNINLAPFHITKGCKTTKDISKLIELIIKKDIKIKSLNVSNCIVSLNTLKTISESELFINNLESLNLHKTLEITNQFENFLFFVYIKKLKNLKLLDISNNTFYKIINFKSLNKLKILSMENIKTSENITKKKAQLIFDENPNLKELDLSNNYLFMHELLSISKLINLKLLYIDNLNIIETLTDYGGIYNINTLISYICNIKNLEYLDFSLNNITTIQLSNNYLENKPIIIPIIDLKLILQIILKNLPKLKKLRFVFKHIGEDEIKFQSYSGVDIITNRQLRF